MRKYSVFIVLILTLSLMIGCAKTTNELEPKRTLRVGMLYLDKSLTRLFQIKYPDIKIEIIPALAGRRSYQTSEKDSREKFLKLLDSEKNLDVIIAPDDMYQELIQRNQLKPLEGHMQRSMFKLEQLEPVIVAGLKQKGDGVVFGIPMNYTAPMVVYNKTMFSKRGISVPKKGLTWDEMFLLAKRLKNTDAKDPNHGIYMSADNLELAEMYNESSKIYSMDVKSNQLNVDTPEWEEAWTKVVDLVEDKAMGSSLFTIPYAEGFDISYAGLMLKNTGIFLLENWGLMDLAKDLSNPSIPVEQKVDWEFAPFPIRDARHNYSTRISLQNMVCIPNQTGNVEDAWKFIEFLCSEDVEKTRVIDKTLPITKKGVKYFEQKTGINISALYQIDFTSSNPKKTPNIYSLHQCREEILKEIVEKKLTIKQGLVAYQKKGNEIISQDEK